MKRLFTLLLFKPTDFEATNYVMVCKEPHDKDVISLWSNKWEFEHVTIGLHQISGDQNYK